MTADRLCTIAAFLTVLYAAGNDGFQREPLSALLIATAVAAIVGKLASIYTGGVRA